MQLPEQTVPDRVWQHDPATRHHQTDRSQHPVNETSEKSGDSWGLSRGSRLSPPAVLVSCSLFASGHVPTNITPAFPLFLLAYSLPLIVSPPPFPRPTNLSLSLVPALHPAPCPNHSASIENANMLGSPAFPALRLLANAIVRHSTNTSLQAGHDTPSANQITAICREC